MDNENKVMSEGIMSQILNSREESAIPTFTFTPITLDRFKEFLSEAMKERRLSAPLRHRTNPKHTKKYYANMKSKQKARSWFRKRDRVEIISNIPYQLKSLPRPILGTVVGVDGHIVYVRPLFKRYTVELYDNEIKHVRTR